MIYIEIFIITLLGLVLGSFSTALIYRIPKRISWGLERSACPNCKSKLGVVDLIPLFSWIFSKGRCRYCSVGISVFYPLMECCCALACLGVYGVFGLSVEALFLMASIPVLASLLVIDFRHMILPNQLVFALLVIGLARLFYFSVNDVFVSASDLLIPYFGGALIYAFLAWGIGFVMTKIKGRDSLGLGDVKFFFVAGFWLGLWVLPHFLIVSGILGILLGVGYQYVLKKKVFPFGPALIVTFFGLLLYQGHFVS